jgi:hypothetical protein
VTKISKMLDWVVGYGHGTTGNSVPSIGGATVGEVVFGRPSSAVVSVPDVVQVSSSGETAVYSSVVAIVPIRSGVEEQAEIVNLIAAAPDLLAVAQLLYADDPCANGDPRREMLRKAIAKATGEKP